MLHNGSTLTISFQYDGDNSATFTNNNGTFSESHSGWFIVAARMSINNDGNLVAEFDDSAGDFSDTTEINTITLYPATNKWTLSKGSDTMDPSDYKFAVNGTDITDQLTQQ